LESIIFPTIFDGSDGKILEMIRATSLCRGSLEVLFFTLIDPRNISCVQCLRGWIAKDVLMVKESSDEMEIPDHPSQRCEEGPRYFYGSRTLVEVPPHP
jgi:hypothetical protein